MENYIDKNPMVDVDSQFVCDYCGAPVSMTDESCPSCKSIFSNIRCPRCKFSGKDFWFKDGCPRCKYKMELDNKSKRTKLSGNLFISSFLALIIINILLLIYLIRLW